MKNYTKFRNMNRGYMKLDVWHRSIELFKLVAKIVYVENKIDFKLRTQIADSAQSVSSNIAEGYSRRSINEYLQFLYIALGSLSETVTRAIGLKEADFISEEQFQQIDTLHYEVENKLFKLVESLQRKKDSGNWSNRIADEEGDYDTQNNQQSIHPPIHSSNLEEKDKNGNTNKYS